MSEGFDSWVQQTFGVNPGSYGGGAPGGGMPGGGGQRHRAADDDDDDDDLPPTPMQLPPDDGRKQKVVQMEALDLSANSDDDATAMAVSSAHDQAKRDHDQQRDGDYTLVIAVTALVTAWEANYGVMVNTACVHFSGFAKQKIADMPKDINVWDILGPVLEAAVAVLAPELSAVMAVSAIGKRMVEQAASLAEKTFVAAAQSSISGKGLSDAIETIVQQSQTSGAAIGNKIAGQVVEPLKALAIAIQKETKLTAEQQGIVESLHAKAPEVVAQTLGMPSAVTAKQVGVKLFQGMVKAFEKQRMFAYSADNDLPSEPRNVEIVAGQHADEEGRKMQAELDALGKTQ